MKKNTMSVMFVLLILVLANMVVATDEMNGASFNGQGSYSQYAGTEILATSNFMLVDLYKDSQCTADTFYLFDSSDNTTILETVAFDGNTAPSVNHSIISGHRYLVVAKNAGDSSFNPDQGTGITTPVVGTVANWLGGTLYNQGEDNQFHTGANGMWCISGFSYELPACTPDWSCNGYASCLTNDTRVCNNVTDLNTCGESYSGDYSEFNTTACDYCTPDWSCSTFGGTCALFKAGCTAAEDANDCYADTGLASDQYAGTYGEFGTDTCGATSHSSGAAHQALITPTSSEPEQKGTAFSIFGGEKFNFLAWLDNAIISFKKLVGLQQ